MYRVLLRLFPSAFRAEHGAALERLFTDMRLEWEEERGAVGPLFWGLVAWDTARHAAAEWLTLWGNTIRSTGTMTGGEQMTALLGDVRFALRQLVRQPLYGSMIVLLMTLAIAGNAAVFRVYNGLFLKPLPFDDPEQLVDINETAPSWDLEFLQVAYRDFDAWRADNRSFHSMAAYSVGGGNLVDGGAASRVDYISATFDIADVMGVEPLLGRFFGPSEDQPDGPRTALLSEGFWQQDFGGDPGVLGRTVTLNGVSVEIIGVLPAQAALFRDLDMWLPLRADPDEFTGWGLSAIGRLAPGVTVEQANADLLAIHKGRTEVWPENEISSPVIAPLRDRYLGDYRLGSGFLLAAVAAVLLIACANIAGLMTARSFARGREIAVRRAMGAPRRRIIRQLLTESLVLAAIGAGSGAALGVWGSGLLVTGLADQFPAWVSFDLDARFLLFTLAVTVGAALLFGLTPALRASGGSLGASNRNTPSARSRLGMNALVAGEVALALALLVVGGLSALDVWRLGRMDPGFEPEGLLSYQMGLPAQRYADASARLSFTEEYLANISAIPGVESVAVTSGLPLSDHWGWFFMVDGAPPRAEDEANPVVLNRIVSAGYFETVGVRMAAGRTFDPSDGREGQTPVIIVNETFVRTHLAHLDDPIGARLVPGTDMPGDQPEWMTVIGVARDVKHYGMDQEMRPGVYQPLPQLPIAGFQVALRTNGDFTSVMSEVRTRTAALDVELPVYSVEAMSETLDESMYTRRATSWLIGLFSGVALLMALAGIYGVISYSVGQRSHEISIRMAMGAQATRVQRDVVSHGMRLVALGALAGVVIALAAARLVAGILVGVSATDPGVYLAVTTLVLSVAAVANYVPARRAAGMDPMRALRGE